MPTGHEFRTNPDRGLISWCYCNPLTQAVVTTHAGKKHVVKKLAASREPST